MKTYIIFVLILLFLPIVTPLYATSVTDGLQLWLRGDAGVEKSSGVAADNNDTVYRWLDQSGQGHDMVQSDASKRPVFQSTGIGDNAALSFNGVNQWLTGSPITGLGSGSITVFAVATGYDSSSQLTQEQAIFADKQWTDGYVMERSTYGTGSLTLYSNYQSGDGSSISASSYLPVSGFSAKILVSQKVLNTSASLYIDGILGATTTSGVITQAYSSGNIYISNHEQASESYNGYHGGIAELLVYNRALSTEELNEVGFYLEEKYGLNTAYVSPVPEVSSLLLFLIAALAIIYGQRHQIEIF